MVFKVWNCDQQLPTYNKYNFKTPNNKKNLPQINTKFMKTFKVFWKSHLIKPAHSFGLLCECSRCWNFPKTNCKLNETNFPYITFGFTLSQYHMEMENKFFLGGFILGVPDSHIPSFPPMISK